jgi:hypothetical protein
MKKMIRDTLEEFHGEHLYNHNTGQEFHFT